jgi:hypothetical protein
VVISGPIDQAWDEWEAWHPVEAARVLGGVEAPWYVAAGWAIDLFLGGPPREHEDLEVAVPRDRFGELASALAGYELFVPAEEGGRYLAWPLADSGDRLATRHQTWVRDPSAGRWRLDLFREPHDGDTWICRRDDTIRLPYTELIEHTADGIPYGRPEIVLLFKATRNNPAGAEEARGRDERDLDAVLEVLEPSRRRWLAELLARVRPGHEWLTRLR